MNEEQKILGHFDYIFKTDVRKHIKLNMPLLKYLIAELGSDIHNSSTKYKELIRKQIEIANELCDTLTLKQQELFNKYKEAREQATSLKEEELFCFGYIFAKELEREGNIKE